MRLTAPCAALLQAVAGGEQQGRQVSRGIKAGTSRRDDAGKQSVHGQLELACVAPEGTECDATRTAAIPNCQLSDDQRT